MNWRVSGLCYGREQKTNNQFYEYRICFVTLSGGLHQLLSAITTRVRWRNVALKLLFLSVDNDISCSYEFVVPEDRLHGMRLPNGSFNGVIGMVSRGVRL